MALVDHMTLLVYMSVVGILFAVMIVAIIFLRIKNRDMIDTESPMERDRIMLLKSLSEKGQQRLEDDIRAGIYNEHD